MANDTADVTNVKGVLGGYAYSAPVDTTDFSSDPFADISSSFANLSFVSADGIDESLDSETTTVPDMNGDVVYVVKSAETETYKLTLIGLTAAGLQERYGHDNVTEGTDYMTVTHKLVEHDDREYVFDLLLKDGRQWRKVIPCGQVTEVGEQVLAAKEVWASEITITCKPDASGVRVYDYIENATTTTTTTTTTGE